MLHYPDINPIALQLGFIKIRWYGLMYLVGITAGWGLLLWRHKQRPELGWTAEQIGDLIFYAALGVVLGGRLGYMLFYDFTALVQQPLLLFKTWEGGMSFHGGLLGVVVSMAWFSHRHHKNFADLLDFIAPVVPIGLAAGRIGNFINGELWGRTTTVPWGMIFPSGGPLPRHPSQLYESLLEGVVLFALLWWFSSKPRPRLAVSGLFLLGYGVARFVCEFFREPDWQKGFIAFDWLTMGQLLTMPMIVIGAGLLWYAYQHRTNVNTHPVTPPLDL